VLLKLHLWSFNRTISVVCSCNVQGYSQVFDIISLELFWYGGKVDPKLEGNLRKFFTENDLLQTWSTVSLVVYVLYVI
jgi:hypothetical protein